MWKQLSPTKSKYQMCLSASLLIYFKKILSTLIMNYSSVQIL